MGVRRAKRVLAKNRKIKGIPLPARAKIDRMLKGLFKHGYTGVRNHCTLCEIAAGNVAKQLNAAGKARVDARLVSRAALGHDLFRHLATKGMNEERVSVRYFQKMGFPEIAELVGPLELLHIGTIARENLGRLSLEQKIVLYVDGVCRGVPIEFDKQGNPRKWRQDIFSMEEAYQTLLRRHLEKRKDTKGAIGLLDKEFFLKWLIELELMRKGLDIEKLIRDTKREYTAWKRKQSS